MKTALSGIFIIINFGFIQRVVSDNNCSLIVFNVIAKWQLLWEKFCCSAWTASGSALIGFSLMGLFLCCRHRTWHERSNPFSMPKKDLACYVFLLCVMDLSADNRDRLTKTQIMQSTCFTHTGCTVFSEEKGLRLPCFSQVFSVLQ